MTLRRLVIAMAVVCGLCVWGFARSSDAPAATPEGERGNHDEAEARYRNSQSHHWRHVVVGNYSSNR